MRAMVKPALLVIDMQEALVGGAYDERNVLERISAFAERMVAAELPVIFVQHNHSSFQPMMKGEPGWMIHRDLKVFAGEPAVEKRASDAFYGTELEATLREMAVDTLLIAGMQTEFCVDATCRSALSHGFDVVLLSDCHTTGDSGLSARQVIDHHNSLLAMLAHPDHHIVVMAASEVKIP
jgi:nicotinamidase-related amidase